MPTDIVMASSEFPGGFMAYMSELETFVAVSHRPDIYRSETFWDDPPVDGIPKYVSQTAHTAEYAFANRGLQLEYPFPSTPQELSEVFGELVPRVPVALLYWMLRRPTLGTPPPRQMPYGFRILTPEEMVETWQDRVALAEHGDLRGQFIAETFFPFCSRDLDYLAMPLSDSRLPWPNGPVWFIGELDEPCKELHYSFFDYLEIHQNGTRSMLPDEILRG